MPRSGQGGVQRMDLSALPKQTKAGVYQRAKEKYPDIPNEPQMRQTYAADQVRAQQHADKFGYGDLNPSERKLTDPFTGEISCRSVGAHLKCLHLKIKVAALICPNKT